MQDERSLLGVMLFFTQLLRKSFIGLREGCGSGAAISAEQPHQSLWPV